MAQGETVAALTDLEQLIGLYEEFRARIREESNRNSFFEQEQDIYDVAIEIAGARLNDKERAFNYAETGRARSLLDEIRGGQQTVMSADSPEVRLPNVGKPLTLAEIQQRLPEQAQILQYAVLEDKLVIWLVTRHTLQQKIVAVPLSRLTDLVTGLLHQLSQPPTGNYDDWSRTATELYSVLIQPLAPYLAKDKQLCLVPDKILNFLPYEVLLEPATKRFLLEDQQLLYAPSASLFVLASEAAKRKAGFTPERILCVGNPRFDRRAFPELIDLPAAAREAETVANYYGSRSLLLEERAKKGAVLREMEHAEVIHLALHHIADAAFPLRSKFLLAAEPQSAGEQTQETGLLTAREIYHLNLARARLVVLSACQTRVDSYSGGEGPIGITRAFEAAGVPLIVSSLWAVDSNSTAHLMTDFHRLRQQQKLATTAALRTAQLAMFRDATGIYRHPYYWASFVVVGGYSDF